MSEPQKRGAEWLADVAKRMQQERDGGNRIVPEILTVRELILKFGYYRRSRNVVREIRKALEDNGLHTTPHSFDIAYIDNEIKIEPDEINSADENEKPEPSTIRIDGLTAAHNKPMRVKPDDLLAKATTIMQFWDYSQLPVMVNDRDIKGMINWRSIGEAYAHGRSPETVKECMEIAHVVDMSITLSDAANEIYEHDYILVRGQDRTITGIVTASDIAYQFKQLAHPFLLIGEIESHLRSIVHGKFTVEELNENSGVERDITGPNELTLGGYLQLFGREENWSRLELKFDRKEFIHQLNDIRETRNEIMHFSVDELEEEKIMKLERMAFLLRKRYANSR